MIRNYLTTAIRNLARNPLYSFINIAGLAIGLAVGILILLFVRDELSYDSWLADATRIYRLESTFHVPGRQPMIGSQAPGPAKAALEKAYPDRIEEVVRILRRRQTFDLGDRQFNERIIEVDPNFFRVFDLPMVAGEREAALADTSSIILSERLARKFFGNDPALGQTVTINRKQPETFRVAGVMKDLPANSHLEIDAIIRFNPDYYADNPWVTDRWTSTNVFIYAKFRSRADAEAVARDLKSFVDANVNFQIPAIQNITPSDILELRLTAVPDIHLRSISDGGFKPGGSIVTVTIFSAVAVLILLIASINFMNLATARSMQRAREVAMRKVMGASRRQLIVQFLGESVMLTLIAFAIALALVHLALPWYNAIIDKQLRLDYLGDPGLIALLAGLAVTVGVLGGTYPAFYLSHFRPVRVLSANQASNGGAPRLRTALVVLQFAISIALMVSTAVVYEQMRYARNMDLGFAKDHLVVLLGLWREKVEPHQETILQEIASLPGVVSVGRANDTLPKDNNSNTLVDLPDVESDDLLVIETMNVDDTFFRTLDVTPLAGRLFSPDFAADAMPSDADKVEGDIHLSVVINARTVKQLGFSDAASAVGRTFRVMVGENKKADATVIGVVPDLHFRSVREKVTPMIYFLGRDADAFGALFVRLRSDHLPETLAAIDDVWGRIVPDVPVRRDFVDENFARLYAAEEQRARMFAAFSILAIFVACLGLFGLASFAAERRTREISIRKVLGATVPAIVRLLVWQFSKPVIWANLIAWPVAFYFMRDWLSGFIYRIDLAPWPFLAAGALAVVIAWATVGLHAARVARSNPSDVLRYE